MTSLKSCSVASLTRCLDESRVSACVEHRGSLRHYYYATPKGCRILMGHQAELGFSHSSRTWMQIVFYVRFSIARCCLLRSMFVVRRVITPAVHHVSLSSEDFPHQTTSTSPLGTSHTLSYHERPITQQFSGHPLACLEARKVICSPIFLRAALGHWLNAAT